MQYVHMKHISVLHQANECLDLHSDISSGAEVHSLPPRSPKSSKTSAFACRSSLTCLSIRQMGFSSTINLYMMFRYQHLMTMRSMIMQMTPMTPEFQDPTYRSLMHLRVRASMQNTFPSSSHRHLDRTGVSGMVSRHLQSKSLSSATLRLMTLYMAFALLWDSNPPYSELRSEMPEHSKPRHMLGLPFRMLTPLSINMPGTTAWPGMPISISRIHLEPLRSYPHFLPQISGSIQLFLEQHR